MADPTATDKTVSPEPQSEPVSPATPLADFPLSTAPVAEASVSAPAVAAASSDSEPAARPVLPMRDSRVKPLKLLMLLIVFAITGVGSLMLLASSMRGPNDRAEGASPVHSAPAAVDPGVGPTTAAVEPAAEPSDRPDKPRWTAIANTRRAGYGVNAAFELAADHDIEVWRKRVRPMLTLRCTARTTEVFIVTQAPATIEGNSNRHTVKIGFDGQEPVEQTWEHSIDHDALFAPNGGAMMRQIARSREMSFSFAPFNAPPATVTFSTAGFDAHQKAAASKCRS